MKYVMFDDLNSFTDLDLIHVSSVYSKPTVKTNYVEVPGRNGALDMSECFGAVTYSNATVTYTFEVIKKFEQLKEHMNWICSQIHGKKFKITESEETYYYIGRTSANWGYNKSTATLTVVCTCEPFRYQNEMTEVVHEVIESKTILLHNEQMETFPTITTDAPMRLVFGNKSIQLTEGTHYVPSIMLAQGINELECYGTGTITIEYQEGAI